MFTERQVVTCFLTRHGRILLLQRSEDRSSYPGHWSGVTGTARDEEPFVHAVREIQEQLALPPDAIHLLRRGTPLPLSDVTRAMRWKLHPFLFALQTDDAITIPKEFIGYRWFDPRAIGLHLNVVPMLTECLARVWDADELGPPAIARGTGFAHDASRPRLEGFHPDGPPHPPHTGWIPRSLAPTPPHPPDTDTSENARASEVDAPRRPPLHPLSAGFSSEAPDDEDELEIDPSAVFAPSSEFERPAPIEEGGSQDETLFEGLQAIPSPSGRSKASDEDEHIAHAPLSIEFQRNGMETGARLDDGDKDGDEENPGEDSPAPMAGTITSIDPTPVEAREIPNADLGARDDEVSESNEKCAGGPPIGNQEERFRTKDAPSTAATAISSDVAALDRPIPGTRDVLEEAEYARDADEGPDDDADEGLSLRVHVVRRSSAARPGYALPGHETFPLTMTGEHFTQDLVLAPLLEAIEDDRTSHSHGLMRQVLNLLRRAGERSAAQSPDEWLQDLRRIARAVISVRPSLPGIAHVAALAIHPMERMFEQQKPLEWTPDVQSQAHYELGKHIQGVQARLLAHATQAAAALSEVIPSGSVVIVAGYSSIVLDMLSGRKPMDVRLIIPEGRPGFEGRLMARATLAQEQDATLIIDAALGHHAGEADLVVLDAEGLLDNGGIVHRMGAYPAALAADAAGIPVYACAPLERLDLRPNAAMDIVLEEKEWEEVWDDAAADVDVRNVYYEIVPPHLIDAIITEEGIRQPSEIVSEVSLRTELYSTLRRIITHARSKQKDGAP